jgi:cyclase
MLFPRLIPCLLIHKGALYKTTSFENPKYLGDPLNAVRLYNDKEVDELIVIDIDASRLNSEINYNLISKLSRECRMPLCYGGGVKSVEQFEKIVSLGVEKVAVSSAAIQNPSLITEASKRVGKQSVVAVVDVKKNNSNKKYDITYMNGSKISNFNCKEWIVKLQELGVGEIVINSVDNDGKMKGYNFEFIDTVYPLIKTPLTVLGGAGSLDHIRELYSRYCSIGAAAGSLFVFKGKFRAVLINYPNREEKDNLFI